VGGISFLTLRFESATWRQRFSKAREEIVEHPSQHHRRKAAKDEPGTGDPDPVNELTISVHVPRFADTDDEPASTAGPAGPAATNGIAVPDIADGPVPRLSEEEAGSGH
jgi:hypothetical protein